VILHVKASGDVTDITPPHPETISPGGLQALVGGSIECLHIALPIVDVNGKPIAGERRHADLIVNEDGIDLGLPLNEKATTAVGRSVLGDVVLLTNPHRLDD